MSGYLEKEEPGVDLLDPEWACRLQIDVNCVDHGEEFKCGSYTMTALRSAHDVRDCSHLYLVNDGSHRLFYGLDADENTLMNETIGYFSDNKVYLDAVILDHTYGYNVEADNHLSAKGFIAIITEMKKRGIINQDSRVFASHISHEGTLPHDEFVVFAKQYGYEVAFDGLVLNIG